MLLQSNLYCVTHLSSAAKECWLLLSIRKGLCLSFGIVDTSSFGARLGDLQRI